MNEFKIFQQRIFDIKNKYFLPKFMKDSFKAPIEVCSEFYDSLNIYMKKYKKNKRIIFKSINNDHLDYFKVFL